MKLTHPKWHIEPGWPVEERARTTIRCIVTDFYPYVGHKILLGHRDITDHGKAILPTSNT